MWKSHQQNKYEKSEKRDKQSVEKNIKTSQNTKTNFICLPSLFPRNPASCVSAYQRRCQWSLVVCRTWCLSGGAMLTEEDWLRPKNPPKQSKIAKRLLQTHLINISSLSPRVVLPHEHLLWRPRQQERKKMPTESSCLLDSVPEWGCCGLNRIDWRSKPPKQPKIIKNCQKTKRLLQIHLINKSYIWSSLSPRVVSPHEHLLWRPRQQEREKMPAEFSFL